MVILLRQNHACLSKVRAKNNARALKWSANSNIKKHLKRSSKDLLSIKQYTLHQNEVFYSGFLQWMWPNPRETADLVTFTEKFLNGKLHFLCSDSIWVEIKEYLNIQSLTFKHLIFFFIFIFSLAIRYFV